MSKYYRLNVWYDLPLDPRKDKRIENLVGMPRSDSGAGLGHRDLGWVFEMKSAAKVICERLKAAGYEAEVDEHDDDD